jgi:hypothetical protein
VNRTSAFLTAAGIVSALPLARAFDTWARAYSTPDWWFDWRRAPSIFDPLSFWLGGLVGLAAIVTLEWPYR